jgi:Zn-dependent protease with chaperone function
LAQELKHGLQHALIKAFKRNSANLNPDWLYGLLNQSHPSLYERIMSIEKTDCSKSSIANIKKLEGKGINEALI